MKGKRYSTKRIIGLLKADVPGINVADMMRYRGIPEQGTCRGKLRYGEMMSPRLNA